MWRMGVVVTSWETAPNREVTEHVPNAAMGPAIHLLPQSTTGSQSCTCNNTHLVCAYVCAAMAEKAIKRGSVSSGTHRWLEWL